MAGDEAQNFMQGLRNVSEHEEVLKNGCRDSEMA